MECRSHQQKRTRRGSTVCFRCDHVNVFFTIVSLIVSLIVCREEAHQFELKLKKFANVLEQGIELTMWQMNRNVDFGSNPKDEFTLKGSQVQLKLERRGEFLVQAALTFSMKGGYLQKALNRRRGMSTV